MANRHRTAGTVTDRRRTRIPSNRRRLWLLGLEDRVTPSAPAAPPGFASSLFSFSDTPGVLIPPSGSGAAAGPATIVTLNVTGAGTFIHDVDLLLNATHTFPGDFDMTLKSPAGTIVTISSDNGGSADNAFGGTRFDDQADPGNEAPFATATLATSNVVSDASYTVNVVRSDLTSEEALAAFIGEDPNGVWTLTINDDAGGDTGTLNSWGLDITTLNGSPTLTGPTTFSDATVTAIPNPGASTLTINVTGVPTYLDHLKLFTNINHLLGSDLDITLKSPSGTVVTITTDNSAVANAFTGTIWDDDADPGNEAPFATATLASSNLVNDTVYTANVTAPTLVPEEALAAFRGENPNGIWTLVVSDDLTGANSGTVNSWSLDIFTTAKTGTPTAKGTAPDVAAPGGTTQTVTVVYTDDVSINAGTIGTGDIKIKTPGGTFITPTKITAGPSGPSVTATYDFTPPGGTWDITDAGTYTIVMVEPEVEDNAANPVPGGNIGSFKVGGFAGTIVVDNAGDASDGNYATGQLTLREAILIANTNSGTSDTISFDPGTFATYKSISVGSELKITDSVLINGTDRNLLQLNGGLKTRLFRVDGPGVLDVIISNMTLSQGIAADGSGGGALLSVGENVTLNSLDVVFNVASTGSGGAISCTGSHTINVNGCRILGNRTIAGNGAGVDGGPGGGTVNITETTIAGNTASSQGAAVGVGSGTTTIVRSTLSGNRAVNGAAIYLNNGSAIVENSTISGNTATTGGGAVQLTAFGGEFKLLSSTMTANSAGTGKGGGINLNTGAGTIRVENSIVSGNVNVTAPDIYSTALVYFNFSAAGSSTGFTPIGSNNLPDGADLKLGPLVGNGGPTLSHRPAADSPLLDQGSSTLTVDQRNQARPFDVLTITNGPGGSGDIGAVELDPSRPTALASLADLNAGGGTTYQFKVNYSALVAIDAGTIDNFDIRVTGPNGFNQLAQFVPPTAGPPTSLDVTYQINAPGGTWDSTDNGIYVVSMEPNQVTAGGIKVLDGPLNSFLVTVPATYLVDLVSDVDDGVVTAGNLTLREAIGLANTDSVPSAINFSAAFSTPQVINVASQMNIIQGVTINAPPARLTLDGAGAPNVRAFNVDMTTGGDAVSIAGMTIQNFSVTGDGGAIHDQDAVLTLTGMVLMNNTASVDGGGVNLEATGSSLTVVNSVFDANVANTNNGGGINVVPTAATVSVKSSSIRNNLAPSTGGDGAGIFTNGTTLLIENTTISGNTANNTSTAFGGGGVYFNNAGTMTVINSTVSGNSAAGGGGGLHIDDAGTLNVFNSTIANNTSTANGGGINLRSGTAIANLVSTIVAGNSGAVGPDVFGNASATVNIEATDLGNSTGITNLVTSGFNLLDTDPLLNPLADNGGFLLPDGTKINTHSLQATSPTIDKGANPQALAFDQRGSGFNRSAGAGVDMGSFEIQGAAGAAKVSNVKIDDGTAQRSLIRSLTVTFDQKVELPANPADAFTLTKQGGGSVTLSAAVDGTGTIVTITFTGGEVDAISLKNGRYNFSIDATKVTTGGGTLQLDGNGDGTGGDNFIFNSAVAPAAPTNVWRLFGDADGDNDVDTTDFGQFRLVYGSTGPSIFDFDNDNDVDTSDFGSFRANFGTSV